MDKLLGCRGHVTILFLSARERTLCILPSSESIPLLALLGVKRATSENAVACNGLPGRISSEVGNNVGS